MAQSATAKSRTVEIGIELDTQGQFVYRPALQQAKEHDSIKWSCDAGDFTVSFPERSPFDKVTIYGSQTGGTDPQSVRDPIEPGVYHYHVAVAVPTPNEKPKRPGGVRIHLDSGCPGIEVSR